MHEIDLQSSGHVDKVLSQFCPDLGRHAQQLQLRQQNLVRDMMGHQVNMSRMAYDMTHDDLITML